MCGIACILHTSARPHPPDREVLERMAACLHHRGPDEAGLYRDAHAGLVHTRLAIIDVACGQQPMSSEEEDCWLAFNGEIFNYVEIREELKRAGHRFRTNSDTEVILAAYRQWQEGCFEQFNGQWAVALWDVRRKKLVLSRDRVGVRPLFVHETPDRIVVASEVKALFADPSVPRRFDPAGLGQVFSLWSTMAPRTPFDQIQQVPAASTWTYGIDGQRTRKRFWQPVFSPSEASRTLSPAQFRSAAEELRFKLAESTRLRMVRSDVPVGSYLSGGIDSSVIAWMGREAYAGEYHTFSIRFADAAFDETPFQRLMARHMESTHHELTITREDIARVFPAVVSHTESPVLRTAPAPMYLLSKLVHDAGFKAVLTGEGADEFLAGYDLFREAKIRTFWAGQPQSNARPRLFERIYPYLRSAGGNASSLSLSFWRQGLEEFDSPYFSHGPRWRTTMGVRKFLAPPFSTVTILPKEAVETPAGFSAWDPVHRAQFLEITTLLSGYLLSSQGDRMLMAHSVEGRFPFLDSVVMDFCLSLPSFATLPGLDEKRILKEVAREFLPKEILRRKKQPYRAPDAAAFLGDSVPEYVEESLSDDSIKDAGVFEASRVRALRQKLEGLFGQTRDPMSISNSDNMSFVGILSTQLLHSQLIRDDTRRSIPPFVVIHDRQSHPSTIQQPNA